MTSPSPEPRRWYQPKQVADALQVSPATVYRAIRAKKLPAKRVFGQWRIPADIVDDLVDVAA